jgi:hypothetical protein
MEKLKNCDCKDWQEGMKQLDAIIDLAWIHNVMYTGGQFVYCPTRNLSTILKYWYEGTESRFNIRRQLEIMATTGRKSELDVCHTFHFYFGIKTHLFQ